MKPALPSLAVLAAVAGVGLLFVLLPWQWGLGVLLVLTAAAPLLARRFLWGGSQRVLQRRGAALAGAAAEVQSTRRITRDGVIRAFEDPKEAVEILSEADRFGLRRHCVLEAAVAPAVDDATWDPGEVAFVREGARMDIHNPPEEVALVLGLEVANRKGVFEPYRGHKVAGPATLRFTLAHLEPAPRVSFAYYLEIFGSADLRQTEQRGPAALHAPAQVFVVEPARPPTVAPVNTPAETPRRRAPAPVARAMASPPADRPSAWRFPAEVILDVFGHQFDAFSAPPIAGLDVSAFRPVSRIEAPGRFSASRFAEARAVAAERETASRANALYRVRVSIVRPENLAYLAEALTTAASLARESEGVVHDLHANRLLTHDEIRGVLKAQAFDIATHITVDEDRLMSGHVLRTRGMAKFGRADIGFRAVPPDSIAVARHALLTVADYLAGGQIIEAGEGLQLGGTMLVATDDGGPGHGTLFLDDTEGDGCGRWIQAVMRTAGAA